MDKLVLLRRWLALGVAGLSLLTIGALIGACGPSTDADTGDSAAARLVKMVTVRSDVDPVPGHENHQLAMLLPPDTTGRVFTGTLSYNATKPVDVVVLFPYSPPGPPSASHGVLETFDGGGQLYSFTNIETGKFATVPFSGAGLALHTLSGEPFEASASIRANVEDQTLTE